MIFRSLASSSKGNAYLISDTDTTILLECGISYKQLEKRTGFQMANIAAWTIAQRRSSSSSTASRCTPQRAQHGRWILVKRKSLFRVSRSCSVRCA